MRVISWLIVLVPITSGLIYYFITGNGNLLLIIFLIYSIMNVVVEILKLVFKKNIANYSHGITRYIFFEDGDSILDGKLFFKESLVTAKGRMKFAIWYMFFLSLLYVVWFIITRFILK